MKLEEGKQYVTRDGHITSPLEKLGGPEWAFAGKLPHRGCREIWREDGTWAIRRGKHHPLDLVAEWKPERAPESVVASQAGVGPLPGRHEIRVGHLYRLRNGSTVVIEGYNPAERRSYPYHGTVDGVTRRWGIWGEWSSISQPGEYDLVEYLGGPEAPADEGQAFKADAGKPQFDLLMEGCPNAILDVVKVLTFAVTPKPEGKGYAPHSWKEVPEAGRRYLAALHRHLNAVARGETHDPESGLPHWAHIATNALFLSELHQKP